MRKLLPSSAILLVVVCLNVTSIVVAQSLDEPVVEAVLFYSPNCGHCHHVINEVLIPFCSQVCRVSMIFSGEKYCFISADT